MAFPLPAVCERNVVRRRLLQGTSVYVTHEDAFHIRITAAATTPETITAGCIYALVDILSHSPFSEQIAQEYDGGLHLIQARDQRIVSNYTRAQLQ